MKVLPVVGTLFLIQETLTPAVWCGITEDGWHQMKYLDKTSSLKVFHPASLEWQHICTAPEEWVR